MRMVVRDTNHPEKSGDTMATSTGKKPKHESKRTVLFNSSKKPKAFGSESPHSASRNCTRGMVATLTTRVATVMPAA